MKKTTSTVYTAEGVLCGSLLGTWELEPAKKELRKQAMMGIFGEFFSVGAAIAHIERAMIIRYY